MHLKYCIYISLTTIVESGFSYQGASQPTQFSVSCLIKEAPVSCLLQLLLQRCHFSTWLEHGNSPRQPAGEVAPLEIKTAEDSWNISASLYTLDTSHSHHGKEYNSAKNPDFTVLILSLFL